jgi:hypothetical protein
VFFSHYFITIICLDINNVRVLAPGNFTGKNRGQYIFHERIGNIRRECAAKLAPIMDAMDSVDTVSFEFNLFYTDTSHSPKGYRLKLIVLSSNSSAFNDVLLQNFTDAKLFPEIM